MNVFASYVHLDQGASAATTAPASPTAALEYPETGRSRRRLTSSRVSFAEDSKTHDGLSGRNQAMDTLVRRYFVEQREVSELDVLDLAANDVQVIARLHEDLVDLCERLEEALGEGKPSVPVLPRGGGMCTKLCGPHVPYIKILDRVVEAAGARCMRMQQGK